MSSCLLALSTPRRHPQAFFPFCCLTGPEIGVRCQAWGTVEGGDGNDMLVLGIGMPELYWWVYAHCWVRISIINYALVM